MRVISDLLLYLGIMGYRRVNIFSLIVFSWHHKALVNVLHFLFHIKIRKNWKNTWYQNLLKTTEWILSSLHLFRHNTSTKICQSLDVFQVLSPPPLPLVYHGRVSPDRDCHYCSPTRGWTCQHLLAHCGQLSGGNDFDWHRQLDPEKNWILEN